MATQPTSFSLLSSLNNVSICSPSSVPNILRNMRARSFCPLRMRLVVTFLFLHHLLWEVLATQCYSIDGTPSIATPCTPNPVSHCCSPWDVCVGDTLCLSQFGTLYAWGCTDPIFTNTGCPNYCIEAYKSMWMCKLPRLLAS
jgi:hypothetical protein